jgi:TRAP-type C4-dicarboxylate transport system substrate-binding protein
MDIKKRLFTGKGFFDSLNKGLLNLVVLGITLLGVCTLTVGCSGTNEEVSADEGHTAPITLTLSEMHVVEHPITKMMTYFAEEVESRTDGRVHIDVRPAEIDGTATVAVSKVRNGSLDLARVSSINMTGYNDKLIPLTLPYMFESDEHMWRTMESDFGEELLNNLNGCEGLAWIENGSRCFFSDIPIHSPKDMQGTRFRVPESPEMYALLRSLGAIPYSTDLSKVYTAIRKGTINGAENDIVAYSLFADDVVAKYYVKDNHSYAPSMLIASSAVKSKIGDDDYAILLECAKDTQAKSREIWAQAEEDTLAKLDKDVEIYTPTEEEMQQFKAAATSVYADYSEYQDEIDKIKSFAN